MKCLCVILALGILACATYAAPASSEIQQEGIDPTNEKELLDLIDRVAKTSQINEDDTPAEAQFWGGLLRMLGKPLLKLAGEHVIGRLVNRRRGNGNALIQAVLNKKLESIAKEQQGNSGDDDDGTTEAENQVLVQAFLDKLMDRDSDVMAAIENLPEKARSQFLFSVGVPALASLISSMISKG